MNKEREEWQDVFSGCIPTQNYFVQLENGEYGLKITLIGQDYRVHLNFGLVEAIQMLDEGANLNYPEDYVPSDSFWAHRRTGFASTIYLIQNGNLSKRMRTIMGEVLFDMKNLHEYHLITLNYEIWVLCQRNPDILVIPECSI